MGISGDTMASYGGKRSFIEEGEREELTTRDWYSREGERT